MTTRSRSFRWRRIGVAALTGLASLASVVSTHAAPWDSKHRDFATPAFEEVWRAADQTVAESKTSRSWTWGPAPWFDYQEFYKQSPNGLRQVQYFDKARMEINNPAVAGARGVTNGLLPVEMVSGRIKIGDGTGYDENMQRQAAQVPVAGDPLNVNPNSPTYASFGGVATLDNGYRDPDRTGQRTSTTLDKQGNRANNAALGNDSATEIVAYNTVTGHNIPRIFRDFINNGPVDGLFAFGYPITDPYWIKARVGGSEKDIFVQLFERRVLTYTPTNPEGFKVEMGNVGQHYFQWRYEHLGQPWLGDMSSLLPIAFASKHASADHWETFTMRSDGNQQTQITSGSAETVPYSWRRSYIGGQSPRLITDSRRDYGARRIFSINLDNPKDIQAHSPAYDLKTDLFNPAISPDGNLIVFALSQEWGKALAISTVSGQANATLFTPYDQQQCEYQSPTWLPDGSGIVYASSCSGKFAIYRADLQIQYVDPNGYGLGATLINQRMIAGAPNYDNYFPRISPDGSRVVYSSNRNGQGDIYVIGIDGKNEQQITNHAADDGAASWSSNGGELVFDSNRDGDYELYSTALGVPGSTRQLTNNTVDDRWPLWYQ